MTQRLLSLGPSGDVSVNDLVWALCPEPEEHWDEGRVIQLPKASPDSTSSAAPGADAQAPAAAAAPSGEAEQPSAEAPATAEGEAAPSVSPKADAGACYLVSWRDGQAPSRVQAKSLWKMTADEDVMMATAALFAEVSRGEASDVAKVSKFLEQGADLMAINGEGCTVLLAAVGSGAPLEVHRVLLDNGACPDATSREGVTPLQQVLTLQGQGGDGARLAEIAELLEKHGAEQPKEPFGEQLRKLRETFGLKMVSALLTLQSPLQWPVEVLEVLHLLLRELPMDVIKQALGEHKPGRIKPGRIKRAALSLQNQSCHICVV